MTIATRTYPLAHVNFGQDEMDAVMEALLAGETTCGKRVAAFEERFAEYVGRKHAVMVNSGSSADLLVAHALGPVEPGDEILVPAVTWPTQVWSCVMAGYTVRLVDVDPRTLQMDVADLKRKISIRTRAIFLVHVLGNVGNLDALDDVDIPILEDCCEALGAKWKGKHVGTFGVAAAYSFFFSHLITTMEGGMVVTDDDKLARDFRLWRSHGWEPKKDYRFWFPTWGLNVRPTEVQGAFGTVQMQRIEEFRLARAANYRLLGERTRWRYPSLMPITVPHHTQPSWHGFPVIVRSDALFSKAEICQYLEQHGIETRPIIAGNFARQPAAKNHPNIIACDLPGADLVHEQGFYTGLPMFDDPDGTAYVGEVVSDFMRANGC